MIGRIVWIRDYRSGGILVSFIIVAVENVTTIIRDDVPHLFYDCSRLLFLSFMSSESNSLKSQLLPLKN
jgi:hypothetical protein